SQEHRAAARSYGARIGTDATVVTCAKGMEQSTGRLLTDVLDEELPGHKIGVLSGPGFAADIARGLPTAMVVAARNFVTDRRPAETAALEAEPDDA
ncbi:hypothetical protein QN226_08910, partial [Sinorhizobium sp. 6-117]|nr:hypothetical protein [Sinorhizobium sp. 6-117]